jgi:trans-aconitate methyltransferase
MLERARALPGGDSPKIRWLHGRAEEVETEPPYALITAGESLHWMDWETVLPRWSRELSPHGMLAIAYVVDQPTPWSEGAIDIIRRYATNPTYDPAFKLTDELTERHLFERLGERETSPISVQQTVEEYVAAYHARSSLALNAMTAENALRFDAEMQDLLAPFAHDHMLMLTVAGGITWGRPNNGDTSPVQIPGS